MKRFGELSVAMVVAAIVAMTVGTSVSAAEEPVPVPDVMYATLPEARQALEDRGLSSIQLVPTTDPYCNNLGDVLVQSPVAGTPVSPGTVVRLSLGVENPVSGCPERAKFLFLNIGWRASGDMPESPLVPSGPIFKYLHGPVDTWFNEASLGRYPGFDIQDGGSYMVETPDFHTSTPGMCDKEDFSDDVFGRAQFAASQHGFDLRRYTGVFVYFRTQVCDNIGGLRRPAAGVWASGGETLSIPWASIHEFGHFLGLSHSTKVVCENLGGVLVSLSNNCKYGETTEHYGGMGSGINETSGETGNFTASHLNQLGWLDGRYATVRAQDSVSFHYVIKPLGEISGGLHAVKLLDGPTLWIEYRKPVGLDARGYGFEGPGLIVHLEKTDGESSAFLLNLRPTRGQAPLPVGQTWANPLGTMKITLDSLDDAGAHITISSQLTTVPDVRNMSLQQARSAIEGAGLAWGGTRSILTTNCDLVGSIVGSEPSGNTRQPAGSLVTVTVAELDPRKRCN